MKNVTSKWIEAGRLLSENPDAKVTCPNCERAILEVHDILFEQDPTVFERYMTCHACGARNVLRIKKNTDETKPKESPPSQSPGQKNTNR